MATRRPLLVIAYACLAAMIAVDWLIPNWTFYTPFGTSSAAVGLPGDVVLPIFLKQALELALAILVIAMSLIVSRSDRSTATEKNWAWVSLGVAIGFSLGYVLPVPLQLWRLTHVQR